MTVVREAEPGEQVPTSAIRVTGPAEPDEVAAIIAVLVAASGGSQKAVAHGSSRWSARAGALRRPVGHGLGAWRTSLRP